jgi:hypothetical protein
MQVRPRFLHGPLLASGGVALLLLAAACNDGKASNGSAGADAALASDATVAPKPVDAAVVTAAEAGPTLADALLGQDDAAAGELMELHAYRHHGLVRFVSLGLDTIGVPAERVSQIEALQRDLDAATAPARASERALLLALASGVEAGNVDPATVAPLLADFTRVSNQRVPTADALDRVHTTLLPAERAALADKVLAHWTLSRTANAMDDEGRGRLARLRADLGMSAEQTERVRVSLHAMPPLTDDASSIKLGFDADTRMQAFAAAFPAVRFDAKSLAAGDVADGRVASAEATRMVRLLEAATPTLTSPQRLQLAARLRDHAGEADTTPAPVTAPIMGRTK